MSSSVEIELEYLVLRCRDLERTRLFYEALGLRFTAERHGGGSEHWACEVGGVVLELYPAKGGERAEPARLGLRVEELESACDRLRAAGFSAPQREHGAVLRDPDGRAVELRQR